MAFSWKKRLRFFNPLSGLCLVDTLFDMKLSKEEILHIAQLARLSVSEEKLDQFAHQLSDVLEYVEKLSEVDTDGVEETSQVTGLENVYRYDEIRPFEDMQALVEQAPRYEDNQVKVPKVL